MKKKVLLIILSLASLLFVFAEQKGDSLFVNKQIDSLENVLYNALSFDLSPIEKITICIELAELYDGISNEKQVEYAARSLILAEEKGDNALIIQSLKILAEAYYHLDDYEKSIEYYSRLYNIYNSMNDELAKAEALYEIGYSYYGWSKYVEAKNYYERSLDIYKQQQFFTGIAQTLAGIASILSHWGEYEEALNYNQEALNFWEEIGNRNGIASVNNNIGTIYEELGNLPRASEYYHRSLDIFQELGDTWSIVNVTLHIGDIYLRKELYDKALEYYFKADQIGRNLNNKKLKSITLSNIGEAYNLKGDYLKALDYQERALKLKEEIGDKRRLAITYTELGIIYYNVEEYGKALDFLNKGLETAMEIKFTYQLNKIYLSLSQVHEKLGNHKKALQYHKLFYEGKEKIYSEESKQAVSELLAKYQLEKKDKEIERRKHNEQLDKAKIRNQQLIIGFVMFILLGLFILSIALHSRYQQNQKLNIQLSLQKNEIEQHQKKVENLNTELKEANTAKDKFFSIVAHDLKNPFNSLIVLTGLLLDDYDTFTDEERKQFITQIKASSENTYALLQNLLDWASTQSGKSMIVRRNIDISKISDETVALVRPIAKNKKISIKSNIPDKTYAFADKNMVSTVMLNLVSNAVKFTQQNGEINIKSLLKNNHVEVMVSDSGVGISQDNLGKLFKLDEKIQTEGTEKEKGTGLGLILCKEFVEKNKGKIWVESEEGKGSKFYFSLPVK
jgi:signal transduction histidine kinase